MEIGNREGRLLPAAAAYSFLPPSLWALFRGWKVRIPQCFILSLIQSLSSFSADLFTSINIFHDPSKNIIQQGIAYHAIIVPWSQWHQTRKNSCLFKKNINKAQEI
jgi:hypothetical protein